VEGALQRRVLTLTPESIEPLLYLIRREGAAPVRTLARAAQAS
jgi:hypothetical protein